MKRFFYRILQIGILCGFVILIIPVILSAIPFIIFLLAFIYPLNHANRELREDDIKVMKGGNGDGNITLH